MPNKRYDNVQLTVTFGDTLKNRNQNISSGENIAQSLGKISTWYDSLVPTGGSSGQFLGWNSDGTAKWVSNPNSDTKVTDTVGTANTYYPAGLTGTTTATSTQVFDTSFKFIGTTGTTSAVGKAQLVLGNSTVSGTANNKQGSIVVYGSTAYAHTIQGAPTAARTLTLPDKTGTFALTSDIPSVPTVNDAALTLKGAGTTVTTFTANASSAKSLDIVAGSNVTVTADATNAKISIASSHPSITKSTDTTSTASPAHGGTFTVVDSITREANGHVTKINTKTVTLPADSNTDTKVTQTNTTTSADYRVLLSGNANDTTETTTGRKSANLTFNPSSGGLYSFGFRWTDITGSTLDIDTLTLSDGTLHGRRFIEKTDGGASNITNIPVAGKPFLLEVDLIRWASTTDYITRQRFTNAANGTYSYVRYCTNGTWGSWTTRKYTDTNTKVTSSANHYTPATASDQDKSASASGATAAWSIDVVKGVTLNTDGKGHVTGISVTSGKIPANPVPSNNVTGSGTSGYLTKWNGTNTITNGPQLGSSTTTFLRNDGSWATPINTDTKVTQSETTATEYRPIVFGTTYSTDTSTLAATITGQTYVSTLLYAQPQGGILYANRMYLKSPGSRGQLNLLTSKYNVMLRNDDSNTYFLVTAQNDPTGTWTSARPLTINNSTGVCSINGNAATSSSWATAKTLTLSGQLTGSVSVKGDADMTLSGWLKKSLIYDETSDFASYAWHKFAEITMTSTNGDQTITFIVSKTWGNVPRRSGILTAHIRTGATKVYESSQFYWQLANSEIDPEDFVFVYTNTADTSCKVELWYKQTVRYDGWIFTVLKEHSRTSNNNVWTLYTSTGHGSASHTTGTNSYASSIAGIKNDTSGTSSNVTGTVAIAHGGTGATTRLEALKALTDEGVGTNAQYFLTITQDWDKGGYSSVTNVKTVLGLKSAAYTDSTDYAVNHTLTNQDLNTVTSPGFYNAAGENTCTNKPTGINAFGLEVIHSAAGNFYTQILYPYTSATPYRRICNSGTWGSWTLDKIVDESVKQLVASSSDTAYRPIIVGMDYGDPGYTATEKTDSVYAVSRAMIKPSTGDVILYSPSGDSPALTFQRGTTTDDTLDWKIFNTGGKLNFNRSKVDGTWENILDLDPTNNVMRFKGTAVSLDGHTHSYLPLSGGTITKSSFGPLTIERTGGTQAAAIYFKNTNGVLGAIGMTSSVDSGLYRWTANTSSSYRILDAGNYTSYTYGATTSRTANTVLAAPNGSNGAATFRKLVAADVSDINYAGSSSAGGAATSADKLNTDAGSTNRPVYFSNGVPVACNVPASGTWFNGGIPEVRSDGVMEIGKIIDFHSTNTSTADYDLRLQYTGTTTGKTVTLPGASGNVALLAKGGTSYYGMLNGDGTTSGWIRTTASGFLPATSVSLANGGDGALGTSSWAFKNAYIANINGVAVGSSPKFTDTKNTAGSTDTSSTIYLIGATSQATNPQTYSDNEVYVTNGSMYAKNYNATYDYYAGNNYNIKLPASGTWERGIVYTNSNSYDVGFIGAYGTGGSLDRFDISDNVEDTTTNPWIRIQQGTLRIYASSSINAHFALEDPHDQGARLSYNSSVSNEPFMRLFPGVAGTDTTGSGMWIGDDTGGMTVVGAGHSAKNLRDTVLTGSTNPWGGSSSTAWHHYDRRLVLSSDTAVYLVSGASGLTTSAHTDWTDVKTAMFDSSGNFRPSSNKKGSIGTSANMWNTIYGATIYENGTALSSKYAPKSGTPSYTSITSITTVTAMKKFTCTANTNTYKTFMVKFTYDASSVVQWFTVTGTASSYYPIFSSSGTVETVLTIQCPLATSATITFTFSSTAHSPEVTKVIGFNFG